MNWKEYYNSRVMSAEEAIGLIQNGDRVVLAHDVAEPPALIEALVKNSDRFKNVKISHMFSLGSGTYSLPEYRNNFGLDLWFVSSNTRESIASGYGDYTPVFFYELPSLIREKIIPVDVVLLMATPPDSKGRISIGVSADYTVEAIRTAKTVIAQINDQVPFSYGDCVFDVTDIDAFIPYNQPLPSLPPAHVGEIEQAIGRNCASIIHDGDCLQLGIGSIPDAVCHELLEKRHLGIHSEMLGDGIVHLYEAGAVDNSQKQIDKGKFVFNFVMGSQKVYNFCDQNPHCLLKSADYVNDPRIICQNDNVVSINSGIGIDLYGQTASDTIGYNQFSGIGGQVDFIRGAAMSRGGRSIIAMSSAVQKKDGKMISKITALLPEGQTVSTSRHDIDYVATEYGIVRLKGKTVKERARALISIAHPLFRKELEDSYYKMFERK